MAALLDTTIVSVALGDFGRELDASVSSVQWVSTGYLMAMAAAIPTMGWLVDRFGTKRVLLGALSMFVGGSALCATAWSIESLILFRVVQGLGGGLVLPLVQAILAQEAGPRRFGRVMGLVGIPGQLAPIAGPVLGGMILAAFGWRWIFLVNIPVCAVALVLAERYLPSGGGHVRSRLDRSGLALATTGLVAVLVGLSEAGTHAGLTDPAVLVCLALGIVSLTVFAVHARCAGGDALIDVRLLGSRSFAAPAALMFLFGSSLYGPLLLLPLYYQQVQGNSVSEVGWLLAPQGLGTMGALWLAGRWTDRVGPRRVAIAGTVLSIVGTLVFTRAGTNTSVAALSIALVVRGVGLGAAGVAVSAASYIGLERSAIPRATSLLNVTQRIGASFGTAVVAAVLGQGVSGHHSAGGSPARLAVAFEHAFWWTMAFSAIGLIPTLALPHRGDPDGNQASANRTTTRSPTCAP